MSKKILLKISGVPLTKRFWDKVNQIEGCWLWTAGVKNNGYGGFRLNNQTINAHRAAWLMVNGEIPKGLLVLHRCDNKLCVNPDHLYLGTHRDNMRDAVERLCMNQGKKNGNSTLTEAIVLKIRKAHGSCRKLANLFGIAPQTVNNIKLRQRWGWL
jgi:hypothetical protein